jgi:UDP:flavonoid glycosyltransferase YjiC (YdhE family)
MKVVLPTIGSRGDVQPYIALAIRLRDAGHTATVATHPGMRSLVEGYGVPFEPVGPDVDIGLEAAAMRRNSPLWIVGFLRVMRFSWEMLERSHADLLEVCRRADLVVVSHTAAGSMEADKLGLPTVSATLMAEAIPVNDPREALWKRGLMKAAGAGMGLMMSRPLNQIRRRVGLSPMGPTGITSPTLNLIALSRHVCPPHPLWESRHRMTGYWFAPAPETWTPPAALAAFLDEGDLPVVVSLGAMALSGEDALEAATITVEAIRRSGVRAVVQGWSDPMRQLSLAPTIFPAGSVPHDWLLARASGLVHHGGFGTTAAGFRSGIPSLVIPHIIDQFIWGQKVAALGVGPKAIPRKQLNADKMADALRRMQAPEMRERAAVLGRNIRSEDGVGVAVRLIEEAGA